MTRSTMSSVEHKHIPISFSCMQEPLCKKIKISKTILSIKSCSESQMRSSAFSDSTSWHQYM